jgi:hypothetical protein
MLILSRVCADFYDKRSNLLFRLTRNDLGLFVDAPESIKQDPLFQMLVSDGSIKFPEDAKTNKALENDPMAGADATGKETKSKAAPKAKAESKPKTETKSEPKPEPKAEDKPAEKPAETKKPSP